ncbi:hypothetical protein FJT64_017283 [Amphibalanus amphitrite]|uniref:Reverse transcriptase domain-containing protein n=1 Tax=Amphibalanus amphitrite TaxID=1232801 RepID=A0A6A4XC66_AMPAM|nr:hypothetical protein FJT64_017283 [Amphibalanus amphitrite]
MNIAPRNPTTSRLQAFGGSRLAVAGVIAVTVETEDGRSCQSSLYVADGSTALLGRDLQRSLHISVKDGSVVCAVADAAPSTSRAASTQQTACRVCQAPVEVVSEDEQLVVAALSEETAAVSADELKAESRADPVLGKLRDQIPRVWPRRFSQAECLQAFLFAYRSTVQATTGRTPAELLHGRPMRGKLSAAVDVGGRLPERPGELHSRVEKKQAYQKRYFDKTHRVKKPDFEIGDRVRHRLPPQSRKGRPRFSRVKKVLERRGPASYVLDDGTRVHADRLTSGGGAVTDSRDEQPQQRIDSQPEQQAAGETAADGRQTERDHAETNSELPQPEQPAAPDADQPLSPTLRTRYGREAMDNGEISILTLLDQSKCFDVVPHRVLLDKLMTYGVDTHWFEQYLENHTQRVQIRGVDGMRFADASERVSVAEHLDNPHYMLRW